MKKNIVALSLYRTIRAANDDESSTTPRATAASMLQTPPEERGGWDPFEVWRTRIRARADRSPSEKR